MFKFYSDYKILISLLVAALSLSLMSCANILETRAYLREANVRAPVIQPPMQPVDTSMVGRFIISPRFSYNTAKTASGSVSAIGTSDRKTTNSASLSGLTVSGSEGMQSTDLLQTGELNWDFPRVSAGVDFDLVLTDFFVLPLGVDLSFGNNESLYGFNVGLGFYSSAKSASFRFDAGLVFQSSSFDSRITVIQTYKPLFGSTRTDTFYLHGKDKVTTLNPYIGITISSSMRDALLNYFLNISYFGQTLLGTDAFDPDPWYFPLPPYYDDYKRTRFDITAAFVNVFPGIIVSLQENMRLMLGARMYFETEINENSKSFFVVPVIKFNFIL